MNNQEQSKAIKRIGTNSNGNQANGQSGANSLSDNGRFVSFESNATNLVANDTNQLTDTFIYDSQSNTVELISLAPNGSLANGSSSAGSISGNGNYVVYASFAANLVANDTNAQRDIFLYDRQAKATKRISVASNGTQANGLSLFSAIDDDGNFVAYESNATNLVANDTNGLQDIFLYDAQADTTKRISVAGNGTQANGISTLGSLSDDGRYVSFTSAASNLVAGDTNGQSDIFRLRQPNKFD